MAGGQETGLDIYRQAFGDENQPLTEQQEVLRRHAAIFAIMSFDEAFCNPSTHTALGVSYTREQMDGLKRFIELFPKVDEVFPEWVDMPWMSPGCIANPIHGYEMTAGNFTQHLFLFFTNGNPVGLPNLNPNINPTWGVV